MQPTISNVPKHVGIILDGNRRFAKRLMLKPWKGHEWGADKVDKLFDWCKELGIKEVTLYAFSLKNFDRPKKEFDYLMKLFAEFFSRQCTIEKIHKNKIKVNFIGRINLFPPNIFNKMKDLMEMSKDYSDYVINFAMAYDGRAEIIDATKKIAQQIKSGKLNIDKINEDVFDKSLYISSEPDLIIRTSGERRTSGFMLWQGSYAEYCFVDKFWPEFEKEDFVKCIQDYSERDRRFGQ